MKLITTGKTLNELHKEYGQGANGFYSHWWADQAFANDRPEAGEYEIQIEKKALTNLTFEEQKKKLKKGWDVPHPAILAEALLKYHKDIGKYLMEDWYSRTSLLDSDGYRVRVGYCDADGVRVSYWGGGDRDGRVALAACRKVKSLENGNFEPIDSSSLEIRVKKLEDIVDKLKQALQ